MCAASINDRSDSQRDSDHCSGYHAAPSKSEEEYGVEGSCARAGTDKQINKATQIATFLNITVFSIPFAETRFAAGVRCQRQPRIIASFKAVAKIRLRVR
jgi:hypothetical protein